MMPQRERSGGFTLLEAVVVLVLVGILVAVAASRFAVVESNMDTEAEILRSHLRYAQSMAIANNVAVWSVNIGANAYSLLKDGAAARLPGGSAAHHTFAPGVTATALAAFTVDDFGSPGQADKTITLRDNSGRTLVLSMLGDTGFIP